MIENTNPLVPKENIQPSQGRTIYLDTGAHTGKGLKERANNFRSNLQRLAQSSSSPTIVFMEYAFRPKSFAKNIIKFQQEGLLPSQAEKKAMIIYWKERYTAEKGTKPTDSDLKQYGKEKVPEGNFDNFMPKMLEIVDEIAKQSGRKVILSVERAPDNTANQEDEALTQIYTKTNEATQKVLRDRDIAGAVSIIKEISKELDKLGTERERRAAKDIFEDMDSLKAASAIMIFGSAHEKGLITNLQIQDTSRQRTDANYPNTSIKITDKPSNHILYDKSFFQRSLHADKDWSEINWQRAAIEHGLVTVVGNKIHTLSPARIFLELLTRREYQRDFSTPKIFSNIGELIGQKLPDEETINTFIKLVKKVGFYRAARKTFGSLGKLAKENKLKE